MLVNHFFNKVIVINLDKRADRLEKLNKQLDFFNINYDRFSAIDAKEMGISPVQACAASHIKAWESISNEVVLILEDDALLDANFLNMFSDAISDLPDDWDVIFFGGGKGDRPKYNNSWSYQNSITGLQAYCINPKSIKYFIQTLKDMPGHIDVNLVKCANDSNMYITTENLVTQFPSFSDIRLKDVSDF